MIGFKLRVQIQSFNARTKQFGYCLEDARARPDLEYRFRLECQHLVKLMPHA